MSTYSFKDVVATLAGPGAAISMGNGAGASDEGISAEKIEDKDTMTVGADGQVMHSLHASQASRVTVRLLKTSPVNAQLQNALNFQRQTSAAWGQNVIVVSDPVRGDLLTATQCAFAKEPVVTWAKDGNFNEWVFYGVADLQLGTGQPVA